MAEANAAAGRTPPLGHGSSASPAAASRIRVDIADVSKLKTAIKDTASEAKKLSEAIGSFDTKLAAVKKATTAIGEMQRVLAGSGVSSARPGPTTTVTAGQGGVGAANTHAGGFSGTPGAGVGGAGSYLPQASGLPSVNLMPGGGASAPQGMFGRAWSALTTPAGGGGGGGSYNRQGTFSGGSSSGSPSNRNSWATTPMYQGVQSLMGAASSIAGFGASHLGPATERSYLLNRYQLTTGGSTSTAAQTGFGASLAGRMGNTALNYNDVTQAFSGLQQTGVVGGAGGASRMGSVGFLSTINPLQGNAASAGQVASTFTSQNYYAMRLAGINMNANSQNMSKMFDQIIARIQGQMGRKLTMTEIQSGAQQGSHLYADLTALGLSPDVIQSLLTYWAARNRSGRTGTAALGASGATNNLGRSGQQMGSAQANFGANVDKGYIGGAESSERGAAHLYNAAGGLAGSGFGQGITKVIGDLSAFSGALGHATHLLETLATLRLAGLLAGGGGTGGLLGRVGARMGLGSGALAGAGAVAGVTAGVGGAAIGAGLLINQGITDNSVAQHAFSDSGSGLISALEAQARAWGLTTNGGWQAEYQRTVRPLIIKATQSRNPNDQDAAANALRSLNAKYHSTATYGTSAHGGAASGGGTAAGQGGGGGGGGGGGSGMAEAAKIIHSAEQYLGTPYHWGGASPRTGFDCSGLVQWSYKQAGISIPRVAADQQKFAKQIDPSKVAPGDLLFLGNPAHHVMMSIGNGKVIEAPQTGEDVKIINFPASSATSVGRILGGVNPGAAFNPNSTAGGDSGDVTGQTAGATSASFLGDLFSTSSAQTLMGALGAMGGAGAPSTTGSAQSGGGTGKGGNVNVPNAPTSVSGNQALGKRMAAQRGWSGKEWNALYALWMQESGWRTNAKNPDSGAYGIPQSLPANKMASVGKDYLTNPVTQIKWGLDYIAGRYHDPLGAMAHEKAYNWYEKGSWDVVRDELAQLHQGEMVLPAGTAAHVRQLIETPSAVQQQGSGRSGGGRRVPAQLVFHVHNGTEAEARQHAARFAKYVAEDHDIEMVASS